MNNSQRVSLGTSPKVERTIDIVNRGLAKRYRAERRFRLYGFAAILVSLLFLALLFFNIIGKGYTAFQQTFIQLDVFFDPAILRQDALASADYQGLIKQSLRNMFPDVAGRRDKRMLYGLVSSGAGFMLRDRVLAHPDTIGETQAVWIPTDDDVDMLIKCPRKRAAFK